MSTDGAVPESDGDTAKVPESKKPRAVCPAYALAYASVLPTLQRIAREHGYALAVHGSMATDLDLVACPWTEEATEPEPMIEAIRVAIDGAFTIVPEKIDKPHGRRGWNIIPAAWIDGRPIDLAWRPWLDISVMPRQAGRVSRVSDSGSATANATKEKET